MTFKTIGIIIAKRDGRDADRVYTIYTKEHGKISALAKSVKKITSKLAGHLELFTYATFTIARGRGRDHIATVDAIAHFVPSFDKSDRLIAALYCLECTDQMVRDAHRDDELFDLLYGFIQEVAGGDIPSTQLARTYLYNLCVLLGYGVPQEQFSLHDHLFPRLNSMPKSQVYFEHLTSGSK
ncbi:MAG: DNA repair protein RecO [bacterium]|nr:DNA repair protein RecO [bacterium]